MSTILYVEDNELNRRIVRDLLKRTSYKLIEAHDGEAGITTALAERPDLMLMDIQLPKISGLDVMRRLRTEATTAATPIIALTSFALSGDDQKAKAAGATAYLTKPFSPLALLVCDPHETVGLLHVSHFPVSADGTWYQLSFWKDQQPVEIVRFQVTSEGTADAIFRAPQDIVTYVRADIDQGAGGGHSPATRPLVSGELYPQVPGGP